ncbi:hypothetical protein Tco_0396471 [Tanacetum coccineum]
MLFLSSTISSRFSPKNNQLRTSSNPRTQATIQDGRVTVQNVHGQQFRVMRLTQERVKLWEQGLLTLLEMQMQINQGQSGVIIARVKTVMMKLHRVQSSIDGKSPCLAIGSNHNGDIVGPYYNSNILSEVPHYDTYQENDVLNSVVQEMEYTEHLVSNNDSYDELTSDNNVISYSDYMVTIENNVLIVPLQNKINYKQPPSGNDDMLNDADIRPINNDEPKAENAEQCHDIRPMPAKLTDNRTTELSNQLLESDNVCLKKTVAQCQKDFAKLEAHCINLELQMQNNVLKSGQQSQFLKEKSNEAKVKNDIDVTETTNIDLEHSVAKLLAENEQLHKEKEHLKQTYKDLFDSIKRTRVQTKNQNDSLMEQLNKKSNENADVLAQIQKKGFAIAALKNELRKLTGNSVNTKFTKPSILGKPVGQPLKNQSVVRQPTAFKSERPKISKPRFASQVDVNNDLSKQGRTQSLVAKKKDISENRASRNFDLMITQMMFEQSSSSLGLHVMMSDHNSSDLAPQRQEMSVENVASGLVPQGQKASDYDNSDPVPPRQNVVPSAEKTDSSQQGLEFLFSPLLEEYYNPTHGQAEENNNDQAPNASIQEDEFINPFCTRIQEIGESSSTNIDNTDVHSFQPQSHDYRWTRDHPLEQVRGNPSMPVQTRRQLATDPEMYELHQFDRLKVWELVDKPFGKMIIKLKWLWKNKKDKIGRNSQTKHRLFAKEICSMKMTLIMPDALILGKAPSWRDTVFLGEKTLHVYESPSEDRFKYLVRRIRMRCLTPAELRGSDK